MDMDMRQIMSMNGAIKREKAVLDRLSILKDRLAHAIDDIADVERTVYTGWYVLLRKIDDKWACVGIFNPEKSSRDVQVEWDLCLPIPDPATVPEFQGW